MLVFTFSAPFCDISNGGTGASSPTCVIPKCLGAFERERCTKDNWCLLLQHTTSHRFNVIHLLSSFLDQRPYIYLQLTISVLWQELSYDHCHFSLRSALARVRGRPHFEKVFWFACNRISARSTFWFGPFCPLPLSQFPTAEHVCSNCLAQIAPRLKGKTAKENTLIAVLHSCRHRHPLEC